MRSKTIHPAKAAFVAAFAASAALAANFPLGTFVYTGSVLNYRHEAIDSTEDATIQAVSKSGAVLASSRVTDPVAGSGVNFVLEVPVATEASAKSAAVGDELSLVMISSGGTTNVSARAIPPVSAANTITNLTVVSASAKEFPYSSGGESGTVLVAEDYLAGIASLMAADGRTEYDPAADWDGDGASNYEEYKSGTNPFDPSDRLRIRAFSAGADSTVLSFEYAGGHIYAGDSSVALTNRNGAATRFAHGSKDAAKQDALWMPGSESEDIGEATIYLAPASSSPSMFYTIRAE